MKDHCAISENGLTLTVTMGPTLEGYYSIMGGDDANPTWEEYMKDIKEEYKLHFELIKKAIIKLQWVGKTGKDISNYYHFQFSDGTDWGFSWRSWGDLMQAIVNKKEGYMTYYM